MSHNQLSKFTVILFYKFTPIEQPEALARIHRQKCEKLGLRGRMIIAKEGINATLEGEGAAIEEYKKFLHADPVFADVLVKESVGNGFAFPKLKVKVRNEVVTLGAGNFNFESETAAKLSAAELQKWYERDEDFAVLDLRNDYEIASGKFDKTFNPGLENFRDLPKKLAKPELAELKNKKLVAVCTGGIRCEKATCLLKRQGFENVYQLEHGIHTYIKEHPGPESRFKGTLFVFDNRMTTEVMPSSAGSGSVREKIGRCVFCGGTTENYCSDDSFRPSRKILCCPSCFDEKRANFRVSGSGSGANLRPSVEHATLISR